jgi:hypothetical protein
VETLLDSCLTGDGLIKSEATQALSIADLGATLGYDFYAPPA